MPSSTAEPTDVPPPAGAVRRLSYHSDILAMDWRYAIYTPPGYETSTARYPSLFMLHGSYGAPDDYFDQGHINLIVDQLIADGRLPPVVIAMPDGRDTWYINQDGMRIEDAILTEFIPRIEQAERVIGTRETRALSGLSKGGYGALRYALKRPDLFRAAALLSPAVYEGLPPHDSSSRACAAFCPPNPAGVAEFNPDIWRREHYDSLMADYLAKNAPMRFFIDCGDSDELGIGVEALRLFGRLRDLGHRARFGLPPGAHNWETWSRAFPQALPYLFAETD